MQCQRRRVVARPARLSVRWQRCVGRRSHLARRRQGGGLSSFSATANHDNAMPHAPWVSYYTPEACEIVARRFAADFEAFGYDAGECTALVHM